MDASYIIHLRVWSCEIIKGDSRTSGKVNGRGTRYSKNALSECITFLAFWQEVSFNTD